MAKVHPGAPSSSSSKQETFTIWMKSLVLNGKGCTVFDSNGQIAYRVDNYSCKLCRDVYLMDLKGEVLFTILRKQKFKVFRFWEGYRSTINSADRNAKLKEGFKVRKVFNISRGYSTSCEVIVVGPNYNQSSVYKIESRRSTRNSPCKIVDKFGRPIAEVKRKQSTCGLLLGDDVLTMVVEPFIDHCLVMGLFVVYSLINCKI